MKLSNFFEYKPAEELTGGDYWQFVDAQLDDIYSFCYKDIFNIIPRISNPELKQKMTDKTLSYVKYKGLNSVSLDALMSLIDEDTLEEIIEYRLRKDDVQPFELEFTLKYVIERYITDEHEKEKYSNFVFDIIKNKYPDKLAGILDKMHDNKELFLKVFEKNRDFLPATYVKGIEISEDSMYARKLMWKYLKYPELIGIDQNIKIGVEVEVNFPYIYNVMPFFFESQEVLTSNFDCGLDATVIPGYEFSSKKYFRDTKEDIALFHALLTILKESGLFYDEKRENAAGQINLGLDYLDTPQAILNFYELFCSVEELLFYISNEAGQVTRQRINCNSRFKPISEGIGKRIVDEMITRDEVINMFSLDNERTETKLDVLRFKENTLCLRGTNPKNYRFEIRIPNGSSNFKTWCDNIRLYGKMLELAKNVANITLKKEITALEENLLSRFYELQNSNKTLLDKLNILMDLLFDDKELKKIYYDRFFETKKIVDNNEIANKKYTPSEEEPSFGDTEFDYKYESRLDPSYQDNDTVLYNPNTGIYEDSGHKVRIK